MPLPEIGQPKMLLKIFYRLLEFWRDTIGIKERLFSAKVRSKG
jgi:hypothetical protein